MTVEAQAEGFLPDHGTLRIRYASGRKQRMRMERGDGNAARYAATIENVQEAFTCVAALHDGRSEGRQVRVLPRPTVVNLTGRQTYPAYTSLPPSAHQPGEFLLFPGSELDLTVTASQPLRSGTVVLLGREGRVNSFVDPRDPHLLHARFTAPDRDLTGFMVELLDAEEMASQDATVYRVDILSDDPPVARILKPSRQSELVTVRARVELAYEVEDRFGIERVELRYAVAAGEGPGSERGLELPLAGRGVRKSTETFDWPLEDIRPPLQVGDEIRFWIEAYDRNADTAAGKSAPRDLKVVTPREKRDDLLGRVGDSLGRIDQAADDQERLNAVLAEWLRAQTPPDQETIPRTPNQNGKDN
ncbi:MAG: hypothetical protein GWO24_34495 [Akkermansiaceae bacterium]|nr:hypothetical protein [Akkermansiaceae bacterium]